MQPTRVGIVDEPEGEKRVGEKDVMVMLWKLIYSSMGRMENQCHRHHRQ